MSKVTLSSRERATLIRLLGMLQDHLEGSIESSTIGAFMEGETEATKRDVALNRRDWRLAEDLVAKLSGRAARAGVECIVPLRAKRATA